MEKKEFLERLARALAGQVSQRVIEENLRYYDNYLTEEAAKGKSMHQVLEELGEPRLIAKSIIDANGGENPMAGVYEDAPQGFDDYGQEDYQEEMRRRFRQYRIQGFWAMILLVVVLCLVLLLIGTIIGGIFLLIRPLILPLLLCWLVYWIFRGPRSGGYE